MTISYNNQTDYNYVNYLTFTEVPNILKVQEYVQGSPRSLEIAVEDNFKSTVSGDGQYYITILGETITNVMSPSNAKNKRFYISNDGDTTAFYIVMALRNCSSLSAQFNIIHAGNVIRLISKEIGGTWGRDDILTNMNEYISTSATNGTTDDIFGSKIVVDVYKNSTADTNYVTSLEKNWYGDECAFDMTPVLATFSEYGQTIPYIFNVNLVNADWQHLEYVSGRTTIGYHANQSADYLQIAEGVQMLMNNKSNERNIILYVYGDTIPYSVLTGRNTGGWTLLVTYLDSAFNVVGSAQTQEQRHYSDRLIVDTEITIPSHLRSSTYYVDIKLGSSNPIRFNIIKPLKATEYYQRVMWRNEYGGISFFDFTGARSETDTISMETYEKNVYDYYDVEAYEKKKIYKNGYEKTVKLTSHLMEENGKWLFNSLARSKQVWTFVNGKKYFIIPKSIEVAEDGTYNNIYKATLTYTYSDI